MTARSPGHISEMLPGERVAGQPNALDRIGKVYLVGAGPGDPELMTCKALRVVRSATVVLHDDLVSPEILALIPADVAVHNVGKRCGRKTMTQDEIHARMIDSARGGHTVVRLKGGDPMIYGRAGEELQALHAAGIGCEVIPGITSAVAAAAAAHVPLTDRRSASSILFLTGHGCGAAGRRLDGVEGLSRNSTVVIYMPGERIPQIAEELEIAGVALTTPCVIVSAASTSRQQIFHLTLQDLFGTSRWPAPSVVIIGEVVGQSNVAAQVQSKHDAQTGYLAGVRDVRKEGPMQNELPRIAALQVTAPTQTQLPAKNDPCDFKREQQTPDNAPVWRRILWNFAEAWYG